jgi:hypothetical protein
MEARRALVGASTKIAVIADVRGNLAALEAVLREIDREGPDEIVQLGNLVGDLGDSEECARLARERGWVNLIGALDLAVIRPGSGAAPRAGRRVFDRISAQTVRWLGSLPRSVRATHGGFPIEFAHGNVTSGAAGDRSPGPGAAGESAPRVIATAPGEFAPRVIATASSPTPAIVEGADGILRVHPGAAGVVAAGAEGTVSYAVIEIARIPRAFIRRAAFDPRPPRAPAAVSRISIPPRA